MDGKKYKPSYVTRVTCKYLEKPEAFYRAGERDITNALYRADKFAIFWREVKDIRGQVQDGYLDRGQSAKSLKYLKKAMLALVQGADDHEIDEILDGDMNFFDGIKFAPKMEEALRN